MVKQQSLIAMEVHPPSEDNELSPRFPEQTGSRRKCGRHSPDRMSSMDEDDVSSFVQYLKPLRESQAELKEQIRTVRSDMRRSRQQIGRSLPSFTPKTGYYFASLQLRCYGNGMTGYASITRTKSARLHLATRTPVVIHEERAFLYTCGPHRLHLRHLRMRDGKIEI